MNDKITLDDFLCFATYGANLAFGRAYKPLLSRHGLTYTQWITLLAVCEQPESTVSQLGERLFLASNTLTPLLKQLEKQGVIFRKRSALDERQVLISPTELGWEIYQSREECTEIFEQLGLSLEEVQALQKNHLYHPRSLDGLFGTAEK